MQVSDVTARDTGHPLCTGRLKSGTHQVPRSLLHELVLLLLPECVLLCNRAQSMLMHLTP